MGDVAGAVEQGLQIVANLPDEAHWLCDKIDDGYAGSKESIPDESTRSDATLHALMLLSFSQQEDNQAWLKQKIAQQLERCRLCVEHFYSLKRAFYQRLLPEHGQENLDLFFTFLEDWDIQRLEPVLSEAADTLIELPSVGDWYEIYEGNNRWRNATHEIFSSPKLLRSTSLRSSLLKMCRAEQLLIESCTPALVAFLFEEDEDLRRLAQKSWEQASQGVDEKQFETQLLFPLEDASRRIEIDADYGRWTRYIRGVVTVVQNVNTEVIMRCISGAEKDAIKLISSRVQPNLPFWPAILRLFQCLMVKLHQKVWEVLHPLSPSGFSDMVFNDRNYSSLLRVTPQSRQGEAQLLDLTEWISEYVASLEPLNQPNTAPSVLELAFKISAKSQDIPALTSGMLLKEGMKVLASTLGAVEPVVSDGNPIVNETNKLFVQHMDLVSKVALPSTSFEDQLMEKHMAIAKQAAQDTLVSALRLNLNFLRVDYERLSRKRPPLKPLYGSSLPAGLWETLARSFPTINIEHCEGLLDAVKCLNEVDKVYAASSDPLQHDKNMFNACLASNYVALARVLGYMGRGDRNMLGELLSAQEPCEALLSLMMCRSLDVSTAAEDIVLAAHKAEDRVEALRIMIIKDFSTSLLAQTAIARSLSKSGLFGMMPQWVRIGMEMMDVLCDKTQGIIRKSDLQSWAKTIVRVYWETQWRCLGTIFRKCRRWALGEDKQAMIEFCRDSMDYAEKLFDNFWTFEQSLRASIAEATDQPDEDTWTNRLLQDASKALNPFTTILSIQDDHLLQTCQKLMCKMLGLLDQKLYGSKRDEFSKDGFFENLRKQLYPETFPDFDVAKIMPTNLTSVQKTELAVAATQFRPDFIPPPKEKVVVAISDDEEILEVETGKRPAKVEPVMKKLQPVQGKIDFTKAQSPKPSVRVPAVPPKKTDAQRQSFLERRKAEKAALAAKKAAAVAKKPAAAAASSSSDDDGSSSDDEGGLFKLGSRAKAAQESKHPIVGQRKPAVRHPPATIKRVKDNRARIAPDLSPLYKQIFKWDIFHQDAFPPDSSASSYTLVAKAFKTYGNYKATFEPLLLLEAWQSFQKAKEEVSGAALEVKISTRMRADLFVELETTVNLMDDRNRWIESDIVLLSSSQSPLNDQNSPHCIARVCTVNKKFNGPREVTLRCEPGPIMLSKMTNGGMLYGVKIMSLIPLEREYTSLICLQYYDLRNEILGAKPAQVEEPTGDQVSQTCEVYNVNEPQAKAIISATSETGFTLIQGPPGTGKTKTVIGIVGAILTPRADSTKNPSASVKSSKLLVCAPSNAAVDELVIRFKRGIRSARGETIHPKIVRVGRSDAINAEVKDVTLEDLIEARIGLQPGTSTNGNGQEDHRTKHNSLNEERKVKLQQLDECRAQKKDPGTLDAEIENLSVAIRNLRREMDKQRAERKENDRSAEILRRRAQQEIFNEAQIICATLSGSGHEMLRAVNVDFETVIIDEAAQSVELSALIPLKFGCEKCILVGDPQQLPPTVLSREAAKFSYEKSLFVRMQENYPKNVHLLSIQYRMHPMISLFPSKEFYNSRLKDGDDMPKQRVAAWHQSTIFGPYRFFSVAGRETRGGNSLINKEEVQVALGIFQRITADFNETNFDGRVGIVTPYRQQLYELRRQFESRYGKEILKAIEFNTVDAFQGRERDIIIFSCVRAADEGGIGFLSDIRRMNVGLTRAKYSLFVLGHAPSLMRNQIWARLVQDAKSRQLFTEGDWRSLLNHSTRLKGGRPPSAPENPTVQEVDQHWDPMDIDDEPKADMRQVPSHNQNKLERRESYSSQSRQLAERPRLPPSPQDPKPANSRHPHIHNRNPPASRPMQSSPQGPAHPNQQKNQGKERHTGRRNDEISRQNPPPVNANVRCLNCGEAGHKRNSCPKPQKRPDYIEAHDPQIPALKDPSQLPHVPAKRLANEDTIGRAGPNKKPHNSSVQASGSSNKNPNPPPPLAPKGVIKRKNKASPFIVNKRPNRPPGPPRPPGPSNSTGSAGGAPAQRP